MRGAMPNLARLIVLATLGDGSNGTPPADVAALAAALDAAEPRSQMDFQDAYFNSAAMHQSFAQKLGAAPPETPLLGDVVGDPAHRFAHEVNVVTPNVWTSSFGAGGGVIYEIAGSSWYVGIRFQ